jgi:hypothetical protein
MLKDSPKTKKARSDVAAGESERRGETVDMSRCLVPLATRKKEAVAKNAEVNIKNKRNPFNSEKFIRNKNGIVKMRFKTASAAE